jgi:purine-cytosine permease-like protein
MDLDRQDSRTRVISVFGRKVAMPRSRLLRIIIGVLLVLFGLVGFLPVLGFWMIPLGLLVLSYEFAMVRRWRRRSAIWWAYRNGRPGRRRQ